ncbi:unnamed protein product [Cuscuta campestris]|uniref:HMA domain-containing protein n=1 Tax=Cuscuta campestris TaxID=132261 RepID=A0A484MAG1_9ASTE|nr:unnamed protein product [Cuscuta campestris]
MDLLCSSQSATAICSSMAEITHAASSSSAPVVHLGRGDGGRAIDRFNPIITDSRRRTQPARNPAGPAQQSDTKPTKKNDNKENKKKKKKKSDSTKPPATRGGGGGGGWRCTKPGDFVTPQSSSSSSRYLLNDEKDGFLDAVPGFDPIMNLEDPNCNGMVHQAAEEVSSSSSSHPQSGPTDNKVVVVLRVSLHCRGCEKKMRKHISRMQGVSSFNIDFVAKKVTVVGDVTPLGVLASISKVKTAQLWSPPPPCAAARRV